MKVEPSSTLAEAGPKLFPRLEVEGGAMPPRAEDIVKVLDPVGSSGIGAGPQVLTSGRPPPSLTFGLFLRRGTRKLRWNMETSLQGGRSSRYFP